MSGVTAITLRRAALWCALLASACAALPSFGQTNADPASADIAQAGVEAEAAQDIVVTGARAEQRSAIDVKRKAAVILGARFRF